jgi:Flp pilus assembly protein TadD
VDKSVVVIGLLLVAAVLAIYWQVHTFEFINLDDPAYVTENRNVQKGLSKESIIWAFTSFHAGYWIPVTWLSLMLDFELYGLNPGGYHLTNVFLHLLNGFLLFLVLQRMTRAAWQSGMVAALFLLHPLHVESVAWITERKDVLSTLFWLLSILAYARYVERPLLARYMLVCVIFALGLMAKPMLVTLPFLLLLLDYWPLRRFQAEPSHGADLQAASGSGLTREKSVILRLLVEKLPLFMLATAASVVTIYSQQSWNAVKTTDLFPLASRFANALVSYVSYIGKMFWPANLAVLYPHPVSSIPSWQIVAAALLLICISVAVIRAAHRYPYLLVGWFWYLGTLVPVIGLVQAGDQAMADRFTYVPLIGLFIAISWGVHDLAAIWPRRRYFFALLTTILMLALMICTHQQLRYWRTTSTVFLHTLDVIDARFLGDFLKQGLFSLDEAIAHYSQPRTPKPDLAVAHNILGINLVQQGRVEEAISQFSQALEINPNFALAHNNLGALYARAGKLDEAVAHYRAALRIEPAHAKAQNNLGEVLQRQGELDEAVSCFSQALKTNPHYAEAHHNLGSVLAIQARLNEAIDHLEQALKIRPNYPEAHNSLGIALARQGNLHRAIDHFSEALRLKPDYDQARTNLELALRDAGTSGKRK